MPHSFKVRALTLILILGFASWSVQAQSGHYAARTPGFEALSYGSLHYEHGAYDKAFRFFDKGAYWGDKTSQHNLGAMWYRGEGVESDPARAWAWFELAAERDYPEFVALANRIWDELDADQRQRGREVYDELYPDYGDAAAIPRTTRLMRRGRAEVTGSRTGSIGYLTVYEGRGPSRDGNDYHDRARWDFLQVIQREKEVFEALARRNVILRDLELVDEDEAANKGGSDEP